MQELTVNYKGVYDALKLSPDLRSASDVFMTKFERPADQSESARQKRAGMGQKVLELYGDGSGAGTSLISGTTSCNSATGGMSAGFVGFPLQTTKERMTQLNGGQFRDGAMGKGGHPYAAHDIMADPGTPVIAILSGKVVQVSKDKCPGRLLAVWSEQQGVTVAYLHLSIEQTIVKEGDSIAEGQVIGFVGPPEAGCGTPHLHIDANTTNRRIGCKRESCSAENKALFQAGSDKIGLPKALFDSYQRLP
jgi:murein DD-endopeptidase MepM/ murein hydrolase activator NlpD